MGSFHGTVMKKVAAIIPTDCGAVLAATPKRAAVACTMATFATTTTTLTTTMDGSYSLFKISPLAF